MINSPDLTALARVVATRPPGGPRLANSGDYTLAAESPFGPGHLVAGQQAAALANLSATAQALQAAAAELAFAEGSADTAGPYPLHPTRYTLADRVAALFEAFASLRGCLLDSSLSLAPRLVHDIFSVAHDRTSELALIGITLAADGSLELDREALNRAARVNPELLTSMLAGPEGLAARLRRLALEVGISVQNIFAAMTPATPGLATLPSRLAQLFGQALVAG